MPQPYDRLESKEILQHSVKMPLAVFCHGGMTLLPASVLWS